MTLENRSFSRRTILVVFGVIVVVGVLLYMLIGRITQPSKCLDGKDYYDLVGQYAPLLVPGENFYTYAIAFEEGSPSYTPNQDPTAEQVAETLASFRKDHPDKSIVVTIGSINNKELVGDTLANERQQAIQEELITAGIPDSAIRMTTPKLTNTEPDTQDIATISLTSSKDCKQ